MTRRRMTAPSNPSKVVGAREAEPVIAVALRYEIDDDVAPVIVASGRGSLANRIVAAAEEAGVAIDENPMLAQALEKAPVGEPIPEELYQAVSQVIGWVLNHGHIDRDDVDPSRGVSSSGRSLSGTLEP